MLVLARKTSETIHIGDDIVIKVIAIRGGQVKIGIDAPPGIRVRRVDGGNGGAGPVPGATEGPPVPGVTPDGTNSEH